MSEKNKSPQSIVKIDDVILTIQPKLCVLSSSRQSCRDNLVINWMSKNEISPCLYKGSEKKELRCWINKTNGNFELLVETKNTINFQLLEDTTIIAENTLKVFKHFKKRKRSRKRHPWSIY
ncbi:DUF3019 domain-containing protein [Pleionea sediminis]|uniref:DUF3019 domain-containing protein n=1 Tax=Pleionea sediminis TaxID=2569479 RepID=UPI0013DDB47A|nr:DUF3019 domain-containing protein [Pleionea sediminis]